MYECPTCGNPVSPQAHTCPHCGQPLRQTSGQQMTGCLWLVVCAAGIFLAMGFMKSGHTFWIIFGGLILLGLSIMSQKQETTIARKQDDRSSRYVQMEMRQLDDIARDHDDDDDDDSDNFPPIDPNKISL